MEMNEEQSSFGGSTGQELFMGPTLLDGQKMSSNSLVQMQEESTQWLFDREYGLPIEVASDDDKEWYMVSLFVPTVKNVAHLWGACKQFNTVISDELKMSYEAFAKLVLAPDSVLLQVGEIGVVLFTSVEENNAAIVDFVFWDRKLSNRSKLLLRCFKWCMDQFQLKRINKTVPRYAGPNIRLMRGIGMQFEGMLRAAYVQDGNRHDLLLFSLLDYELTEDALRDGRVHRTGKDLQWYKGFRETKADVPLWFRVYKHEEDK